MTFPEYPDPDPGFFGRDATRPAAATPCRDAPSAIVGIIDASFTNGEHLKHAQAGTARMLKHTWAQHLRAR